jgi:V/A-type H+-transporting ATPase subunit A
VNIESLVNLPVREQIGRFKYTQADQLKDAYQKIQGQLAAELANLAAKED